MRCSSSLRLRHERPLSDGDYGGALKFIEPVLICANVDAQ
jgi:hypothetical protein